MKRKDILSILTMNGFNLIRNGGHAIYSNGVKVVPVPYHKELALGTVRDIFKGIYGEARLANKKMREWRGK